jgi:hypothetical protein
VKAKSFKYMRASNMKDDLIIKRSMVKVNIKILDCLKVEED